MPLLKLGATDGLIGGAKKVTFRTEQVEAIWLQGTPPATPIIIAVLFKSGEKLALETPEANLAALWAKIEAAL